MVNGSHAWTPTTRMQKCHLERLLLGICLIRHAILDIMSHLQLHTRQRTRVGGSGKWPRSFLQASTTARNDKVAPFLAISQRSCKGSQASPN
eukprot:5717251-Amphidinium_carterae.1